MRYSNLILFTLLALNEFVCVAAEDSTPSKQPNIIFLLSDDQGYGDMGRHGNPILKTPNMDRLHDESIRMVDFCVSPTCAPTRAALMTGMQELNSGVSHTKPHRRKLSREVATLPQLLSDSGYATGMFGKWHLGDTDGYRPYQRGFDVSLMVPNDNQKSHYDPKLLRNDKLIETQGYRTDIFYDAAMDWIEEQGERPFFCYIPTYNAHGPNVVPESYSKPYKGQVKDTVANYFGMLANLDENIGRLLGRLDALGLADNTIVVFINDNGATKGLDTFNAGMRGGKGTIWRGGTRAFCFWRWPGTLTPRDDAALSGHVDILPTLVEMAGGILPPEVAAKVEGVSLVDRLNDPKTKWPNRMLFQHVTRWSDGLADEHRHVNAGVRWGEWHLMNYGTVDGCDSECRIIRRSLSGEQMYYTEHPEVHRKLSAGKEWELYKLTEDPGQDDNVAAENPEIVQQMAAAYDAWWDKVRPLMINEVE